MKVRGQEHKLLRKLRKDAFNDQRGLCFWCGIQMLEELANGHPQSVTADHLIPLYLGGKTVRGNIVAACHQCNNRRQAQETNAMSGGGRVIYSAGDDTPRSPFESLQRLVDFLAAAAASVQDKP